MTFVRYDMSWDTGDLDQGPLPLWFQIAERLRSAIGRGEFRPGDVLPSEARLNERFGVSRTTARASLDRLEQEGLVRRRSGKGSIVLSPRVEQPLNLLASFSEDMRRRGLQPSYVTLGVDHVPATAEVAEALGIGPSQPVFQAIRLFKADERPMGICESWIAPEVLKSHAPPTAAELDNGSLYKWLEHRCGARIVSGHEIIEAATATKQQAQFLEVMAGAALLVARRCSHATAGSPIEYAIMRYRADRYRFRIDLVRQ
jgi:GntR family transcriptional regulator